MIIKVLTFKDFVDEFRLAGRDDQFSAEGLEVLYDMLSECYQDEPYDLDVEELCCEYAEGEKDDVLEDYSYEDNLDGFLNETWSVELSNGNIIYKTY